MDNPTASTAHLSQAKSAKSLANLDIGLLLCGPHARLLPLEDRAEALLNTVFQMDQWMEPH